MEVQPNIFIIKFIWIFRNLEKIQGNSQNFEFMKNKMMTIIIVIIYFLFSRKLDNKK